jgi:hypothetical protein
MQGLRVFRPTPYQRAQAAAEVDTLLALQHTHRPASLLPLFHANASTAEVIKFLHQQLDSMGKDAEILPGLILLGGGDKERLEGGALQSFCMCMR